MGFSQENQATVWTTVLKEEEFVAIQNSIQQVVSVIKRPLSFQDAQNLPLFPKSSNEGMAYIDFSIKRIIQALQKFPEIVSMQVSDRTTLFQVCTLLNNCN